MRHLLVVATLASLLLGGVGLPSAAADEAEDTAKAKQHYQAGLQHYQAGRYAEAIKELKAAYILKRAPALLINIGQTHRKLGQIEPALHFYRKYLSDAPKTAGNRAEVEDIVKQLEAEAGRAGRSEPGAAAVPPAAAASGGQAAGGGQTTAAGAAAATAAAAGGAGAATAAAAGGAGAATAAAGAATPPPAATAAPPPPRTVRHGRRGQLFFHHTAVDEAPPGYPLDVRCEVPDVAGLRVTLYYRVAGQEGFNPVAMRPRYTELVGRIPGAALRARSVQYYIEARDGGGKLFGQSGRAASPNVVYLDAKAPPLFYADLSSSEDSVPIPLPSEKPSPGSTAVKVAKWSTLGVAVALLVTGIATAVVANRRAAELEAAAADSTQGGPPNRPWDAELQEIQSSGESMAMAARVTLPLAAVAAGVATYLFIRDARRSPGGSHNEKLRSGFRMQTMPLCGAGMLGAATRIEF